MPITCTIFPLVMDGGLPSAQGGWIRLWAAGTRRASSPCNQDCRLLWLTARRSGEVGQLWGATLPPFPSGRFRQRVCTGELSARIARVLPRILTGQLMVAGWTF